MARAPETGFYFEPISERLALVVEGSPFPSDDHWAWLGDPIAMTPEQAQLVVAVRWPGVDPSTLFVEFDLNFERAVAAKEEAEAEERAGVRHVPLEFDIDINQLLAQAEELRDQVRQVSLSAAPDQRDAAAEAAAEAERLRELIARAHGLAEPDRPGRVIDVPEAPPQSDRLLRGEEAGAPVAAPPPALPAPALPRPPAPPPESGPVRVPEIMPAEPRAKRPRIEKRPLPPEPAPEPPPEPKPAPRRPNIRNKR